MALNPLASPPLPQNVKLHFFVHVRQPLRLAIKDKTRIVISKQASIQQFYIHFCHTDIRVTFSTDMDFENDKRGVGWTCQDDCLTYANCPEGFDGHNRVNFHTEGSCGQPWLVCCYRMELSEPFK